jgi:hypothetical protein
MKNLTFMANYVWSDMGSEGSFNFEIKISRLKLANNPANTGLRLERVWEIAPMRV